MARQPIVVTTGLGGDDHWPEVSSAQRSEHWVTTQVNPERTASSPRVSFGAHTQASDKLDRPTAPMARVNRWAGCR